MLSTIEDLLHESETMNPEPNSTLCMVNRTRKGNPIKCLFSEGVQFYSGSNDFVRYFVCETLVHNINYCYIARLSLNKLRKIIG